MHKCLIFPFLILSLCGIQAQTLSFSTFATGFSNPVGLVAIPGDSLMYVIEQRGKIRIITPDGSILPQPFLNIENKVSNTGNETGLLGLAFPPDYEISGVFYINYTELGSNNTRICRYKRSSSNPLEADPASEELLIYISQPFTNHNGGHMVFGPDGKLYIASGDGGGANDPQNNAQSRQTLLGKFLRIEVNVPSGYLIPPDNPYFGHPNYYPEIWAYGLRNPWRFSFDPFTGEMWTADVGQNNWEEVNVAPAGQGGLNYGWPCYEGNSAYITAGCTGSGTMHFPVYTYPNNSSEGCSVTGGVVYRGARFSSLFGKYLFSDFCSAIFRQTYPDGAGGYQTDVLNAAPEMVPAIATDGYGELYLLSRPSGNILKISAADCTPVIYFTSSNGVSALCGNNDTVTISSLFHPELSYTWSMNTQVISQQHKVQITQPGWLYLTVNAGDSCGSITDSIFIQQLTEPNVQWISSADTVCNNAIFTLEAKPVGGEFSGLQVAGNQWYTAGLSGEYTLYYTYSEPGACLVTQARTFFVKNCNTGMEWPGVADIRIFPIPAGEILHVRLPETNLQLQCISLTNGQILWQGRNAETEILIPVENLPSGVYLLRIERNGLYMHFKWIKL